MSLKMLREHLCVDQQRWQTEWPPDVRESINALFRLIDTHRPIASNGKHGELHTAWCGCDIARPAPVADLSGTGGGDGD